MLQGKNRSTYNAMILSLRGNPTRTFNFQASYTLSHAMDFPEANTRFDQDAGLNIPDQNAYFSYWGDANWDVRQRFAFSEVYTLPGLSNGIAAILTRGWTINGLGAIQSGTPYWVIQSAVYPGPSNPAAAEVACSAAPAGSTLITPIQMAPGSGDYNMDGTDWDVPKLPRPITPDLTADRHTSTEFLPQPIFPSL